MLKGRGKPAVRVSPFARSFFAVALAFSCCVAAFLSGCASPGAPIERKPLVASAIVDLAAQQVGNSIELTFTLPEETPDRRPLTQPLAVEIFRDFAPAGTNNPVPPATLLVTIPPAMTSNYVMQGRFHYTDELRAEDFSAHPDSVAVYDVRTRASRKRNSAPSNVAAVRFYPLPDPIADLKANVTHSGIQLTWTAPTKTPVGAAPPIASYSIYRALAPANGTAQQQTNASARTATGNTALTRIAETQSPDFLDTQIQFGDTYTYSVRSVVQDGQPLESGDSNRVTILARDIFPPSAPQGLLAVYVPAQAGEPATLELSWAISPETDLAGYNVYRSEQSGVQGTRINSEPLPTPAFRDMNAVPGRTYFYSVTAVDRAGNESAPSAQVQGEIPAANQPGP